MLTNLKLQLNHTVDGQPVSGAAATVAIDPRRAEIKSKTTLKADRYLWGIYLMLLIFSVVELFSASSTEVKADNVYSPLITHALYLFLGFGIVMLLQNIHYKYYRKSAWVFMWISAGLVIYSNFFGVVINGAMRAISIAGFTIQPAEIAKLAVVLVLARIMSKYQVRHGVANRGIVLSLLVLALFAGLLFKNGLTNTLLLCAVAAAMFVIGGTQWRKLGILFVFTCCIGAMVYFMKYHEDKSAQAPQGTAIEMTQQIDEKDPKSIERTGTQKGRIRKWLDGVHPEDKIDDDNRQVIFSKIAQAHGGITGNGPGNSRESARLPLAFSDYIFSIIVEDTGFLGGVLLLFFYMVLIARSGYIASKCTKAFPALLITGCATLIVTQACIHMFIVTGIMPVSGQPLPFISKGGTSIIVMSAAMGMMLSVSKFATQHSRKKTDENEALKEAIADGEDTSLNPTSLTYESLPE